MAKYKAAFFGSSSLKAIDFDVDYESDDRAEDWVERTIKLYYPVYYTAMLWKMDDQDSGTLVAEFRVNLSVKKERVK